MEERSREEREKNSKSQVSRYTWELALKLQNWTEATRYTPLFLVGTIPTSPWYYLYDSAHLPRSERINNIAVWARLPGLPIEYYRDAILKKIGTMIGTTIKVDTTTAEVVRGKVGHDKGECPRTKKDGTAEVAQTSINGGREVEDRGKMGNQSNDKGKSVMADKGETYGPWMLLKTNPRGKRTTKVGEGTSSGVRGKTKNHSAAGTRGNYRFQVPQNVADDDNANHEENVQNNENIDVVINVPPSPTT
ncbi:hypothetical protein PIB30_033040 [Stylosanthes scabra]|uniref:DUF4283 domain-containing protein n=1 Tax=Stylosanthes scabra TaxID=79078 RepID=A0ABU6XCL1_9FABA|nr:hypothetical protein [Stylosanthes scabra]